MGFSGGSYTRTDGVRTGSTVFEQQKAASVLITASLLDAHANDIATALSTCILKDGTQTVTADIPFSSNKITGLGDATAHTDACNAGQVQDGSFLWGGTSGGSANAQTIALSPSLSAYAAGQTFWFIAGATNTSSCTLNVNGAGAKTIKMIDGSALIEGEIVSGNLYAVVYDGTDFILIQSAAVSLTDWSPSYSASGSMTFTSVTTDFSYYTRFGHYVTAFISASGTIGGTPDTDVYFTVPTDVEISDAVGGGAAAAHDSTTTKGAIWFRNSVTQIGVRPYDASNWSAGTRSLKVAASWKIDP